MPFSIVIPTRNADNIAACLVSIAIHDPTSFTKVIVIDDDESGDVERATSGRATRRIPGIKPFIFARNINLGIADAGEDDVILLNDDTRLISDFGFGMLSTVANDHPQYGIISAGITGAVGNPEQIAQPGTRLRRATHHTLVFVCVYIRRSVLNQIGGMDEDYNRGYGWEDNHACAQVRQLGMKLGVLDACVIEHGVLPSTFRNGKDPDLRPNLEVFMAKWGCHPSDLKFPHEQETKDVPALRW